MAFNPDNRRAEQLEKLLNQQFDLLDKIEKASLVALTPREQAKLKQEEEETRAFYEKTLAEYNTLQARNTAESAPQLQTVATQLQTMDAKLTAIQVGIGELRQTVVARFDRSEQTFIMVLVETLNGEHLVNTRAILDAPEVQSADEAKYSADVKAAVEGLAELQQQAGAAQKALPPAVEEAARVMEDPKLEFKHRLKVAIPIIPFILTYERELSFSVNANVQAAYDRLKRLIPHRAVSPNPP